MSERWRCFVAVPIGEDLGRSLAAATSKWRQDPRTEGLRWAAAEALHVTLAFVGWVERPAVGGIERQVELVARRHGPMALVTGRLGAFFRPGSARVLWYAVDDRDGSLGAIATDLDAALGLDRSEPFRPHVTLARARRRPVDLRGWIEVASEGAPAGSLEVAAVDLMRSHLGAGPARYETLRTFPLSGVS